MNLEEMKINAELKRVEAARAEMEYIIAHKQAEIERLKDNIKIQIDKEKELKEKLNGGL